MPRVSALGRYLKVSKRKEKALDRDLSAQERTRVHPPGWPDGSYPNNEAEAKREAHPDWPFIEYTRDLNLSLRTYRRVEAGVMRHKKRRPAGER